MDRQLNRHLVGDLRSWEPSILFGADSTVNGGSWDIIRFAPYLHPAIVARCERQATLRGTSLQVYVQPLLILRVFGKYEWCQIVFFESKHFALIKAYPQKIQYTQIGKQFGKTAINEREGNVHKTRSLFRYNVALKIILAWNKNQSSILIVIYANF